MMNAMRMSRKESIRKALENVNVDGAVVLDVGCGSGLIF